MPEYDHARIAFHLFDERVIERVHQDDRFPCFNRWGRRGSKRFEYFISCGSAGGEWNAVGENGSVFPQVHIADIKRLPILPKLLAPDGELARLGAELLAGLDKGRLAPPAVDARKARIEELLRAAFGFAG